MKIIVAPDKFKGSLSTFEAAARIEKGIRQVAPDAEVHCFPIADGGDGFAAVLQHYLHTETVRCKTVDPLGREIDVSWQWQPAQQTAIIELALSSGLVLLQHTERNPLRTTTYGTGILMRHALEKGAKKIILGLGGSATNDAGTGILAALGFSFLNNRNEVLEPCGKNLLEVETIVAPNSLPDLQFEIACDVNNTLHGPEGAAFVYAPQKGACSEDVLRLDAGLQHFAAVLHQQTGKQIASLPGTGAAGGIAAGLMGFFEVHLKRGIDMVMEAAALQSAVAEADLLITGEGRLDTQSKEGKVVAGVAAVARRYKVPVVAFCGQTELSGTALDEIGLTAAFSIINKPMSLEEASSRAGTLLQDAVQQALHFYLSAKHKRKAQHNFISGI